MPYRNDPTGWMWAEACELLQRAERLQRRFFEPGAGQGWQPPVDVLETPHDVWIIVALPGVSSETLSARIESGTLIVVGERRLPRGLRGAAVHRLEIPHGRFERRLELPPGRYEPGGQELAEGCLVIRLRKVF
ncbi:MAG: Hsp20/alpha crystallin family protein [Gammaproteobacteria bacterium]|nr:Hsp20/alpha crystallin family protein [Gammaproteobacteria bacterium]